MTEVTTNGIVKWTNADPSSLVQESQAQGDSIELALSKRERFDFIWANSAERTAQTGMVQSSRGYQVDTKSEYLYDNSAWRLAIPYAEFTSADKSTPNAAFTAFTTIAINPTLSTSTTFATAGPAANQIMLTDPGVYSISSYSIAPIGLPAISFVLYTNNVDYVPAANQLTRGQFAGDGRTTTVLPFYRTTAANSSLFFWYWQTSGSAVNINSLIRIGRLG